MTTQVATGEDVAQLVRRLALESGADRREEDRFTGSVVVELQRLKDRTLAPVGPKEQGIARNISVSGIAIMHTEPVKCKFLSLRLLPPGDEEGVELVMEVTRCRAAGDFFDIAGTLLTS